MTTQDADLGRPLFLYDGDCGICALTVDWLRCRGADSVLGFSPSQQQPAAMRAAGLTLDDCRQAAYVVQQVRTSSGSTAWRTHRGAAAMNFAVRGLPGARNAVLRALARLYTVPGLRQIEDWCYARVARNRHRLRVGTQICTLPPTDEER